MTESVRVVVFASQKGGSGKTTLSGHIAVEAERAHKVKFALGPGVDARHKIEFEARYGIPIVEAWAMTETGGRAVTTTAAHT